MIHIRAAFLFASFSIVLLLNSNYAYSYEDALPSQFARSHLSANTDRWQGALGQSLSRMVRRTPEIFPGAPASAFIGFASGATQTEDTYDLNSEGIRPNLVYHEIGYFGIEAGDGLVNGQVQTQAPTQSPHHNHWLGLHNSPDVLRLLGRAATMVPNEWKSAVSDQAAVGLVNISRAGRNFSQSIVLRFCQVCGSEREVLPCTCKNSALDVNSIRPTNSGTLWAVVLSFLGWSSGDGRARHFDRYLERLAAIDESQRWSTLLRLMATDYCNGVPPEGRRGSHNRPAYAMLRVLQKLEAGRVLLESLPLNQRRHDDISWYSSGLLNEQVIYEIITRAAMGAPIPETLCNSAPDLYLFNVIDTGHREMAPLFQETQTLLNNPF